MTLARYVRAIKAATGHNPLALGGGTEDLGLVDDYAQIFNQWRNYLLPGDELLPTYPQGWAERELYRGKGSWNECPLVDRIEHEAFIAPDGDWHICCLDDQQRMIMGNVLRDGWDSCIKARDEAFVKLREKKFEEVGCEEPSACWTVVTPEDMRYGTPMWAQDMLIANAVPMDDRTFKILTDGSQEPVKVK